VTPAKLPPHSCWHLGRYRSNLKSGYVADGLDVTKTNKVAYPQVPFHQAPARCCRSGERWDIQICVTRRRMRHDTANIKEWKTSRLRILIAVLRYTDRARCVTRII
jgi:hypothetical protein